MAVLQFVPVKDRHLGKFLSFRKIDRTLSFERCRRIFSDPLNLLEDRLVGLTDGLNSHVYDLNGNVQFVQRIAIKPVVFCMESFGDRVGIAFFDDIVRHDEGNFVILFEITAIEFEMKFLISRINAFFRKHTGPFSTHLIEHATELVPINGF